MNIVAILALILVFPFLCFLGMQHILETIVSFAKYDPVFLALSSCLGDRFRARVSGFPTNPGGGAYDQTYFRTMTNSGPGASEHIEMETMLNKSLDRDDEDL